MADIFVSYSNEDRVRVGSIVKKLENAGFTIWWDQQIHGGSRFSKEIEAELRQAPVVLVVWSSNSIESRWVADEADLALETGKLVPITFDGVNSPIGFRQVQSINFSEWAGGASEDCFASLFSTFHHLIQRTPKLAQPIPGAGASQASIAVLPFVNMSSDPEQGYFSDGISEELLNLLAKTPHMRVTARTSSFQFKGQYVDISKIGQILGVAHVLEGSVRKSGDKVRITAQLIEAESGFHLWSETFDRMLTDIFAIQDEICAAIVDCLKEIILGVPIAPMSIRSNNMACYEEYLAAQQLIALRTCAAVEQAKAHFKKSTELDPDFLPSQVGLAYSHLLSSDDNTCYGAQPLREALDCAKPILNRALARHPESEDVHAAFSLHYYLAREAEKAQYHAEKAIALNANCSKAYRMLGLILKWRADPRALVVTTREKVLLLDPASPIDILNLLCELPCRHRFAEARSLIQQIDALQQFSVISDWGKYLIAWYQGRINDGLAVYAESKMLQTERQWTTGLQAIFTVFGIGKHVEHFDRAHALKLYCQYGYREDANRLAKEITDRTGEPRTDVLATTLALRHAQNENFEDALSILERLEEDDPNEWGVLYDIDQYCLGARLSWFVKRKLGKGDVKNDYARKLKEIYSTRLFDHEGIHTATHYLGACIANMEGDSKTALSEMKKYLEVYPEPTGMIFYDPLMQSLNDDPVFKEAKKGVFDHIDSEKQKARDAGYLSLLEDQLK